MMTITTAAASTLAGPRDQDGSKDPSIERIVAALEPIMMAQRRVIARVWSDRSISKLNLHLLMLLDAQGPQSMSELASAANVSLPNLTCTVGRMEELGLVKRVHGEEDRRKVIVKPAAKGRALIQQIESVRRAEMQRILTRLTAHERAICVTAMEAMARAAAELASDE
jgi:DNA-binding MarR family transcriptional regulator